MPVNCKIFKKSYEKIWNYPGSLRYLVQQKTRMFMSNELRKVIRDGKVAVLYSPGFSAGWYTWNTDCPQAMFSPEIVEMVEAGRHDEITDELVKELLGCDYFCAGGAGDLRIEWVPVGTKFYIREYDGSESIETGDSFLIA